MEGKHELCRHPGSCVINTLKGFVRGGVIGLIFRAVLTVFGMLLKGSLFRKPQLLLNMFKKENLKVVLFISFTVGVFRATLCSMRRLTQNEKISSFVAGFLSGIPIAFEHPETRKAYAFYFLVRGLDALFKFGVSRKVIPTIQYSYHYLLILCCGFMHYHKASNPECVNKAYSGIVDRFLFGVNDKYLINFVSELPLKVK